MATSMILKRKIFTKWDETDSIKKMKDSDILAERRRSNAPTLGGTMSTIGNTAAGAAVGGGLAAGVGAGLAYKNGGSMLAKAGKFGKIGAGVGAGLVALNALRNAGNKRQENNFYNDRLEYAKRQALRREKKDWKSNMTQRDGYTY